MSNSSSIHCDFCSLSFPGPGRLSNAKGRVFRHWLANHATGSSAEALRLRNSQQNSQRRIKNTKDAVCDACGVPMCVFNVARHCASEHGLGEQRPARPDDIIICDLCGKACRRRSLQVHHLHSHLVQRVPQRNTHSAKPCAECAKVCLNPKNLFGHWLLQHSAKTRAEVRRMLGDKKRRESAFCDNCGQRCLLKWDLLRHICLIRLFGHQRNPQSRIKVICDLCGKEKEKVYLFSHQALCSKHL